jgi:putative ABC transport system permease protein
MGGRPTRGAEESAAYVSQMRAAIVAVPGVASAAAADILPLTGSYFPYRWGKEDALTDPSRFQAADVQTVLPGYFETMRTTLIAGRTFDQSDYNPQLRRMLIDDVLAAKAFPNSNAVGQRILSRFRTPNPEWFEIVGVVAHQRLTSLAEPGREQAYLPDSYWGNRFAPDWAVRTQGDAAKSAGPVRAAMTAFDRSMLLTQVQTMEAVVARAQAGTRFSLLLIAAFAAIAALLAAVGLYGVLSTVVRQRTAEIGVRMALGAAPRGVFGLMIAYGLRLSAAGIAAGLVTALFLTRGMSSMLVGTKPTDPVSFGAMAALFFLIALLATWIPARRAAGLDPSIALREE